MNFLNAQGPGSKLLESGGSEIGSIFLLLCIGLSVWFFYQRAFTKFITFILFAMFVGVFVFQPDFLKTLGENGFEWLFSAWLK
jgi:hypothetical protein